MQAPRALLLLLCALASCRGFAPAAPGGYGARGAPALRAEPSAPAGELIFRANCAACHAGGQNAVRPERTLQRTAIDTYLEGGFTEKAIVRQIVLGKGAMPAFAGRLAEGEIAAVALYVLRTAEDGWE